MRSLWLGLCGLALAVLAGVAAAEAGTSGFGVVVLVLVLVAAARTLRRFVPPVTAETALVVPLALFPTAVGLSVFNERLIGILILGLALLAVIQGRSGVARIGHPWLVGALLAAMLLPASRFLTSPAVQLWHAAALFLLVLCVLRFPFAAVVFSLLDGVGLYLIANVAGYLMGVQSPASAGRTFALDSSTGGLRVFFPLASSLAIPPLMAAVLVAAGLLCFEGRRSLRVFRMIALGAGVFIMLAANTRVALVVSVVVLLASVLAPRAFARGAVPVAVMPMALPFAYPLVAYVVLQPLIQTTGRLLPFLSRGDAVRDVALEGRSDIWKGAVGFWNANVDLIRQLIGYGEFGQRRSGASSAYSNGDSLLLGFSTHNSTLQQLYDGGLLGVLALGTAALATVLIFARRSLQASRSNLIALGALVAAILGGGTEVSLSPGYSSEVFWVFSALVLGAAGLPSGPEPEPS